MSLQEQIDANRKKIHTDSYQMSLGEIVNLYRDGELIIDPAYQRLFRWSKAQKSKFIDSILLGIPIPSIFVSQRADGVWELIDGGQRVATILQLLGVLRDSAGNLIDKLELVGTKTLPELAGKVWSETPDDANALTSAQRLLIKRAKIDVNIVKKESDEGSKYELFQRLNTTASALTPMEIRNCLLIMVDPGFAAWLKQLAEYPKFRLCIDLSDRSLEELGDRDMACRFIVFRRIADDILPKIGDVH